jgi:hypothetical protein
MSGWSTCVRIYANLQANLMNGDFKHIKNIYELPLRNESESFC